MTSTEVVSIVGVRKPRHVHRPADSSRRGRASAASVAVTRRRLELLADLAAEGHPVLSDNA